MRGTVERSVLVRYGVVGLLALGVNTAMTWSLKKAHEEAGWVGRTHAAMLKIERVSSMLKDVAAAERGYVITGEDRYLEPYWAAIGEIGGQLDALGRLVGDDLDQRDRIVTLRALVVRKLGDVAAIVAMRRDRGAEAAMAAVHTGRVEALRGEIHEMVRALWARQRELLHERLAQEARRERVTVLMSWTGLALSLAILLCAYRSIVREMVRRRELEEQLWRAAHTDILTGLANRRRIGTVLLAALASAHRQGAAVTVILIDVDHFKRFNDEFGHAAGDEVLRGVAEVLSSSIRCSDAVGRHGGEEFLVVLPATDLAGGLAVAERLRGEVAARAWPAREVTISLGVATQNGPDCDATALVVAADKALYRAKRSGRNRVAHQEEPNAALISA